MYYGKIVKPPCCQLVGCTHDMFVYVNTYMK